MFVNTKIIFLTCMVIPTKVILWHFYKPVIFWLTESFENAFSNYNIKLFTVIIPFWAYFKHVALFSYLEISRDKIIFHFISHLNMFYNAIIGNAQHKSKWWKKFQGIHQHDELNKKDTCKEFFPLLTKGLWLQSSPFISISLLSSVVY